MWLLKHNCSWVAWAATRPCTNETHSLAHLQDLIPTLAGIYVVYICIVMPAKVGIKSCRCARECVSFVHGRVAARATQLQLCLRSHM